MLATVGAAVVAAAASAQAPAGVTPDDARAIDALVASYPRALAECDAEAFADLFAPDGYFASGFRGEVAGRERLVALVRSERHCLPGASATRRPGGGRVPEVVLEAGPDGVRGVVDLGAAEYQDEYVKTPDGWRFASRTVIIAAEKDAGLDANEMRAIRRLGGSELGDHYEVDDNGTRRFIASGVVIRVSDGAVTGRVYLPDGGYYDDVYEQIGPGEWRVASRAHVPPDAP